MRFEPHCSCALDVGAGESLRKAANFIGAPLDPDRGGVGVVDESSVGLFLASDGVQNGVGGGQGFAWLQGMCQGPPLERWRRQRILCLVWFRRAGGGVEQGRG